MIKLRPRFLVSLAVLSLCLFVLSPLSLAQEEKVEFRFVGNAIGMSGLATGKTGRLTMTIDHWTTDLETKKLYETLVEGGSEALLRPCGRGQWDMWPTQEPSDGPSTLPGCSNWKMEKSLSGSLPTAPSCGGK